MKRSAVVPLLCCLAILAHAFYQGWRIAGLRADLAAAEARYVECGIALEGLWNSVSAIGR